MTYASPHQAAIRNPGQSVALPVVFFDDFVTGGTGTTVAHKFGTTANTAEWLATLTATGAVQIADAAPGGWITFSGASASDAASCQLNGEAFTMAAGKNIVFEVRIKASDADDQKFFFGLASTDTTIIAGCNDSIGFRNTAGNTADIHYVVEDDTNETTADSTKDLANATFVILRFEVFGLDRVEFFVDGERVAVVKTNLPDAGTALTPTFEIINTTGGDTLDIDYIFVQQDRIVRS